MKRNWQPEELIEHWTLIPTELDLLTKKTVTNRLGIALLLKYFQYEGRFPTSKAEVPGEVVRYVAQLLKVSPDRFDQYDWQGRSIKAHRAIVRESLNVVESWNNANGFIFFRPLAKVFYGRIKGYLLYFLPIILIKYLFWRSLYHDRYSINCQQVLSIKF